MGLASTSLEASLLVSLKDNKYEYSHNNANPNNPKSFSDILRDWGELSRVTMHGASYPPLIPP